MDIKEDVETPFILGRPIMKTSKMLIDLDKGNIKVIIKDEYVCFNLFELT